MRLYPCAGLLRPRPMLEQPPSDFDNHVYVDRAVQQYNAEDPTVATQINCKEMEQLIFALEQRGARVLLFELPLSKELEDARSAKITREIVLAQFPDSGRWLTSIPLEASCAGQTAFIWMNGPRLS